MSSYRNTKKTSLNGDVDPFIDVSDSRRRQSKRDDAIRRKIENDLSKKKKSGTRTTKHKKGVPGTVLSLKPSEPIICKTSSTVYEVSQLMSAKRENCILVVNDIGELLGIFTAKDLAFRIVGAGLSATSVTIDQIMTPNPMCANSNTPASEALNLMVHKGFRHLPVLDENNQIVGVLDITKCYAQQMEKLERMHSSSKKLYEALDNVHSEMGMMQQPLHVFQYFENLKNKMNGPTLESVLDATTTPVYTTVKTTVYDATVLMKENKTTAVLIKDTNEEVAGIFTSKDVVLRVIAAGLDPKKCSIVRVMTPQPDIAKQDLSIQEALRQMFEGRYLNLPIVGNENDIVGIVDVLKLTYATLNQIKQTESNDLINSDGKSGSETAINSEGPAWNKFWTSLDNEDSDSVHSDSVTGTGSAPPDVTPSEFHSFNFDIKPSDSISHTESPKKSSNLNNSTSDLSYTFKFKSPAVEGRVHRISLKPSEGVTKLRSLMDSKLYANDFEFMRVVKNDQDGESYAISYVDDEGDIVSITSDTDLLDCVRINQQLNNDKADLYIHNPHESAPVNEMKNKKQPKQEKQEILKGIPNEVLIPGALAVLATSIIVGFIMSKK
ncbi:DEHA2G09790p [Debaryomyces hansenii CBS767]|uniref:DEHA2G09790p n=1 Tax=Debaryomyces hansenii (strain ATCC 36239 / CBS 767 / BCRC 21394 / JCM 1990 / NBRC 0083 / IGC 2968) TaxID=284592 RepID=Q6BIJ9_DEBHA|nr:CBS/PB1 domain-containing protein [Debaryomyces hansenii CBS767]CAG90442.2 DEHA2G09790p [Debaryomyces hansenii CBS767]|eukprot:XP_461972.2 CBS/PB1 domain-containing protein [Debaryomyces hansenii CBS767]